MTSKRQQTMAKMAREREVKERRARKLEKKHAAAARRRAEAEGATSPAGGETAIGAGLEDSSSEPRPEDDVPQRAS